MGFVADDQIPIRGLQLFLNIFVAAQFVETANCKGVLGKPVAGAGRFKFVIGHDFKG